MAKDARKDQLKKAWKLQQQQQLAALIPVSHQDLRDLFDHFDAPDSPPCDHTLRRTIQFLSQRSLDAERVLSWLRENGAHCDCEVTANVEDKFHDIICA
jgi:hypothetical protein